MALIRVCEKPGCGRKLEPCPRCKGTGWVVVLEAWKHCTNCHGSGWLCPTHGTDR